MGVVERGYLFLYSTNQKVPQTNPFPSGKTLPFMDLLPKDGSVILHTKHLQVLASDIFTVHYNMSTELLQGLFCVREIHYNLRNPHHFPILCINSLYHGSESTKNLAPTIWNLVPHRLRELNGMCSLKNEIKR